MVSVVKQGETDTKHTMKHVLHELIAIVISSVKEMLGMGLESCRGTSLKDWTSFLKILNLPQGNLCSRQGQTAFLCGICHMITL